MNIDIKAKNTSLTPAIKSAVNDKFSVLEPFIKSQHKLHVEIEVDVKHKSGEKFRAEVTIKPDGYFAEARGEDAYAAIDLLVPKIKEQLVKDKDKTISSRREEGAKAKEFLRE